MQCILESINITFVKDDFDIVLQSTDHVFDCLPFYHNLQLWANISELLIGTDH